MGLTLGIAPELAARLRQKGEPRGVGTIFPPDSSTTGTPMTALSSLQPLGGSQKNKPEQSDERITPARVSPPSSPVTNDQASSPSPTTAEVSAQQTPQQTPTEPTTVPTANLPHIALNLEQLIGYRPASDELESIQGQLLSAMWTRYKGRNHHTAIKEVKEEDDEVLESKIGPPDFDMQVVELFETGVAKYVEGLQEKTISEPSSSDEALKDDTTKATNDTNDETPHEVLHIPYPATLQSPVTGEPVSTAQMVRQLQTDAPSITLAKDTDYDFVERLWDSLRRCGRPLFWKRDMSQELSKLIREEQARLEYEEWTQSKRQSKLDHLYSVRETLVHQVELAKEKVELLEEERDLLVREEMGPFQRKLPSETKDNADSLDAFGTSDLAFPDDFQWLGLRDAPMEDEDGGFDEDSYTPPLLSDDEDEVDEDRPIPSIEIPDTTKAEIDIIPIPPTDFEKESGEDPPALQEDLSQTNDLEKGEEEDPKTNEHEPSEEEAEEQRREQEQASLEKARLAELKQLEEAFRAKFTTKDLIVAQTMHNALDDKMNKIEELLESLQDEVWEAEEALEEEQENSAKKNPTKQQIPAVSFSLLDQILAMILGALPVTEGMSKEDHYQYIKAEHKSIVNGWKAHFGRLPPPSGVPMVEAPEKTAQVHQADEKLSASDKRKELGLQDNDEEDWDAVQDWDDLLDEKDDAASPPFVTKPKAAPAKQPQQPRVAGLRPGGSA